jgi:serine palmitoyltransferase
MGKGKRAHFDKYDTPLSSADLIASKPLLEAHSLYNAESVDSKIDHSELIEETPLWVLVTTYLSYFILILYGHFNDLIDSIFNPQKFKHLKTQNVALDFLNQ